MKREYLLRGILATIFAIILLVALFFGIKYLLKDNCDKGVFEIIKNKDCIKINPSCKEKTIEITNNCENSFIISEYNFNKEVTNIEYSDLTGSIKNLIILISKNSNECNYNNLTLITPKTEKDIKQISCNNLFIPNNYQTIITTGKSFSIKNNELSIEGSWK